MRSVTNSNSSEKKVSKNRKMITKTHTLYPLNKFTGCKLVRAVLEKKYGGVDGNPCREIGGWSGKISLKFHEWSLRELF